MTLCTDWQLTIHRLVRIDATTYLAVAASTGKVGFVHLCGHELLDWGLSIKARNNVDAMYAQMVKWLRYYEPDVLIIELHAAAKRKGERTRALIECATAAALDMNVKCKAIPRAQHFRNKYDEAAAIAEKFPRLIPWVPKPPRIWEAEPRSVIFFEAMALWLAHMRIRLEGRNRIGSDPDTDAQPRTRD